MHRRLLLKLTSLLLKLTSLLLKLTLVAIALTIGLLSATNQAQAQQTGSLTAVKSGMDAGLCPLKHTSVKAEVSGFLSRVTVTQDFENPFDEKIEAFYTFPLSQALLLRGLKCRRDCNELQQPSGTTTRTIHLRSSTFRHS